MALINCNKNYIKNNYKDVQNKLKTLLAFKLILKVNYNINIFEGLEQLNFLIIRYRFTHYINTMLKKDINKDEIKNIKIVIDNLNYYLTKITNIINNCDIHPIQHLCDLSIKAMHQFHNDIVNLYETKFDK